MQGLGHNAVCWATGTQQSFELVPRPLSTILLCGQPDYVYACNNNRTWCIHYFEIARLVVWENMTLVSIN